MDKSLNNTVDIIENLESYQPYFTYKIIMLQIMITIIRIKRDYWW